MVHTKPQKPFRLATTSFIYPDYILPNVQKIGAFFDEIELLVFESPESALPTHEEIKNLEKAKESFSLTYNIHLPTDISLIHEDRFKQEKMAKCYTEIMKRFERLAPTTHTLHLEMPDALKKNLADSSTAKDNNPELTTWQDRVRQGLEMLLAQGVSPCDISIETLDYDFNHVVPIIKSMGFDICLDMGHAIKYGYNPQNVMDAFELKVKLIHLHGVVFKDDHPAKDHTGLDQMPEPYLNDAISILSSYTGMVSIEVFNLENLNASMKVLSQYFKDIPEQI